MTAIYEKITKLLRLAERATGPEAELALMRATKFATEHQIDLATINTEDGEKASKEEFGTEAISAGSKQIIDRFILVLLRNHFRVRSVVWSVDGRIELIGRKSDVVFGTYLLHWLRDHFIREWKLELKKAPTPGKRRSSSAFFYGMYQGLGDKLSMAKHQAEDSRIKEVSFDQTCQVYGADIACYGVVEDVEDSLVKENRSKYQLAVVQEEDELEAEYKRLHPDVGSSRGVRINHNSSSMEAGRAAGARTSLPGIPLNNSTRSQLS